MCVRGDHPPLGMWMTSHGQCPRGGGVLVNVQEWTPPPLFQKSWIRPCSHSAPLGLTLPQGVTLARAAFVMSWPCCRPSRPPFVRVRTDFGKFWKLISVFSRTLKVLENQVFCHGLWKVMEIYHVLAENMLR